MESGYSYMEVDSMHSSIETSKKKKNMDVFSIYDWENISKLARRKNPFTTKEMEFKDFLDLKTLVATSISNRKIDQAGDPVNWLKVKSFIYRKEDPSSIGYRYDFSGDYKVIDFSRYPQKKKRFKQNATTQSRESPSSTPLLRAAVALLLQRLGLNVVCFHGSVSSGSGPTVKSITELKMFLKFSKDSQEKSTKLFLVRGKALSRGPLSQK
ncbi:hypothetical protein GE061_009769 [Apolygus lucorum]|uniref:Uncharacterized protein n=1 Tax=Apolygus lucorum TaxID=248454 RepID=A0A8S9Y377_APOLU|nr:hypothetical protein GE061_009769 [Apolygus lucorum]